MNLTVKQTICKKFSFAKNPSVSWDEFIQLAAAASKLYHFPKKITICQAALETARGTSLMARTKNNYFGFMAYDHDPGQARPYPTALDSIIDYLDLITTVPRYKSVAKVRSSLAKIETIHKCGYATDPLYVQKITSLNEWTNPG